MNEKLGKLELKALDIQRIQQMSDSLQVTNIYN